MTTRTTPITSELEAYLESVSIRKDANLENIFESAAIFGKQEMQISWLQTTFLQLLVKMTRAQHVLEIGTFVGFSASVIANALQPNGRVTTCENVEAHYQAAVSNFNEFGFSEKITAKLGDAKQLVLEPDIQNQTFDIVFLDGDKENYPYYFDALKNNLRKGGLFIVDNTLFKGEVVQLSKSGYAKGIEALNRKFFDSDEFDISQITLGDGMLVALKK